MHSWGYITDCRTNFQGRGGRLPPKVAYLVMKIMYGFNKGVQYPFRCSDRRIAISLICQVLISFFHCSYNMKPIIVLFFFNSNPVCWMCRGYKIFVFYCKDIS